jgi:hypothetical protein
MFVDDDYYFDIYPFDEDEESSTVSPCHAYIPHDFIHSFTISIHPSIRHYSFITSTNWYGMVWIGSISITESGSASM